LGFVCGRRNRGGALTSTTRQIEYHIWHAPDGTIRGVGHVPEGVPANLHAIPLVDKGSNLAVATIAMPEVKDVRVFERALMKEGRIVFPTGEEPK
jgi:hypothetical protein